MPTASRKQATKHAPVQATDRRMQEAQRLHRATRRERLSTSKQNASDTVVDRDFHAPPEDIRPDDIRVDSQAEEIEIDPQLDDSESAEP